MDHSLTSIHNRRYTVCTPDDASLMLDSVWVPQKNFHLAPRPKNCWCCKQVLEIVTEAVEALTKQSWMRDEPKILLDQEQREHWIYKVRATHIYESQGWTNQLSQWTVNCHFQQVTSPSYSINQYLIDCVEAVSPNLSEYTRWNHTPALLKRSTYSKCTRWIRVLVEPQLSKEAWIPVYQVMGSVMIHWTDILLALRSCKGLYAPPQKCASMSFLSATWGCW